MFSLVQLFLALFVVPRFAAIFQDMLGNRPLPSSTSIVIDYRWLFAVLACVWLLVALFVVRQRVSGLYPSAIMVVMLFQIFFTVIALFIPLLDHS